MTSGITETGTVLDRIVAQTARDLHLRMSQVSRDDMASLAAAAPRPVDVVASLDRDTVTIIAECKRASPSKGVFPVEVKPGEVARAYAKGGASAISCLTDGAFFQGSLDDLDDVVTALRLVSPPVGVLRKDFTIDPYQIDEAIVHGASAILLIVACLDDLALRRLSDHAHGLGLTVLVEVHDELELERAMAIEPSLVGINHRNLKTLAVDLAVSKRLAAMVPPEVILVGESGIHDRAHVEELAAIGIDAILVGESLIMQEDRAAAVKSLAGVVKHRRG